MEATCGWAAEASDTLCVRGLDSRSLEVAGGRDHREMPGCQGGASLGERGSQQDVRAGQRSARQPRGPVRKAGRALAGSPMRPRGQARKATPPPSHLEGSQAPTGLLQLAGQQGVEGRPGPSPHASCLETYQEVALGPRGPVGDLAPPGGCRGNTPSPGLARQPAAGFADSEQRPHPPAGGGGTVGAPARPPQSCCAPG